jgi:hypothetical protein
MKNEYMETKKKLVKALNDKFGKGNFRINKHNGTDSIDIHWNYKTGILLNDVKSITDNFKGRFFNAMDDIETTDNYQGIGYIFLHVDITEDDKKKYYNDNIKNKDIFGFDFNMEYEDFIGEGGKEFFEDTGRCYMYGHNAENFFYRRMGK